MDGNEAGEHPDESDMLRDQINSGVALIKAGRARLMLALPRHRDKTRAPTGLLFKAFAGYMRSLH